MKVIIVSILLLISFPFLMGQDIIFLHHSTGARLYYEGNVENWFSTYNQNNGTNYLISERSYPHTPYPWDNYPYDYWNLWVNGQCSSEPNIECMNTLAQNYNVIIFKHCFPVSSIEPDEEIPSVSSSTKTLANYKLQYRALRTLMDSYPNVRFIVWTLPPLHRLDTDSTKAARAKQFVDWVKTSWLTEDGRQHRNIFIFDFWGLVAETNPSPPSGQVNCLKYIYEISHTGSDSHPNTSANQYAGPFFSQFIVDCIKTNISNPPVPPVSVPVSSPFSLLILLSGFLFFGILFSRTTHKTRRKEA